MVSSPGEARGPGGRIRRGTQARRSHPVGTRPSDFHSIGTRSRRSHPVGTRPSDFHPIGMRSRRSHPVGTPPSDFHPIGMRSRRSHPVGTPPSDFIRRGTRFLRSCCAFDAVRAAGGLERLSSNRVTIRARAVRKCHTLRPKYAAVVREGGAGWEMQVRSGWWLWLRSNSA